VRVLIVFESMYGNTREVATAIAEGVGGDARVLAVHEAGAAADDAELLVVGGPTHMHGLATSLSRRMTAEAAKEDGHHALDPSATEGPGLRTWLRDAPDGRGKPAAAFDTRIDRSALLTGSAARGIARRLRQRGYDVKGSESFFVDDAEGPLAEGERERARAWGASLAQLLARP
jgi:Flavodoxin domain